MGSPITAYMRTLREGPKRLEEVFESLRETEATIRSDKALTDDEKNRRVEKARADARRVATELRSDMVEAKEHVERLSAKATKPDAEALAAGLEHDRAWQRALRQLDAGVAPGDLVAKAGAAGDVSTLRALRAELPAWADATARKGGSRSPVDTTGLVEEVDRALVPHVAEVEAEALTARLEAPSRMDAIDTKARMVTAASFGRYNPQDRMAAAYAANEAERALKGPAEQPA
ncbi:MAG: hypothetical protein KY447_09400 [Actinobacteria bacterium]|nr:hypothetical protein [Actinomycetota bacterium]